MPTYQQSLLNGIDRALETRDPRLAAMFAIFTRLTRDDGPPLTERLARGPSNAAIALRRAARWAGASAAVPIVSVASLMVAIIALGIVTSSASACPPAAASHPLGPAGSAACQSSANGLNK